MQTVPELVKQSRQLIVGQERRLPGSRFREVGHKTDERTFLHTVHDALATELGHPGPSPLACARKEVSVEQRLVHTVSVLHVIDLHIRVIYRNILPLLERQAIEFPSQTESRVDAAFQTEIWLELLIVDGIAGVLEFLRPESEVPRLDLRVLEAVRTGIFIKFLDLGLCGRKRRFQEFLNELVDSLRILRHPFLKRIVGIGLVAKDIRYLQARFGYLAAEFDVAVLPFRGPCVVGHPHLLTQVAACAVLHERTVARSRKVERPTLHFLGLGRLHGSLTHEIRKSLKVSLIGKVQRESVGRGQHVLPILEGQQGELLAELAVGLLVLRTEVGSAAHERLPGLLQKPRLIRLQPLCALVHGLDTGEQRLVQRDVH